MPHPNHCINCDKPATVKQDGVYYCAACALKEADKQKEKENGQFETNEESYYGCLL